MVTGLMCCYWQQCWQDLHDDSLVSPIYFSLDATESRLSQFLCQNSLLCSYWLFKLQNPNLIATKHKMYLYPKGNKEFSMESLWSGIQFNKEEFMNDFLRQLPPSRWWKITWSGHDLWRWCFYLIKVWSFE